MVMTPAIYVALEDVPLGSLSPEREVVTHLRGFRHVESIEERLMRVYGYSPFEIADCLASIEAYAQKGRN
jgi:hypothetical protein